MSLTVKECQSFQPLHKPYKKADSHGLYLEIFPNGSKYWRVKYRFGDKEKRLALGVFPEISLSEARNGRDLARRQLREGIDPADLKKEKKANAKKVGKGIFSIVANDWHAHKSKSWASETARKARMVLDSYLIPKLGQMLIANMSTSDFKPVLLGIHSHAPNLANKARQYCNQIVHHAIQDGLREDGKLLSLRGALPSSDSGHMAAVTKESGLPSMMKAINKISSIHSRTGILLCVYTALRPGTSVWAEWNEFNDNFSEWHIPGFKMKSGNDHITPIPSQIRPTLEQLKKLAGKSPYVFPGERDRLTSHMHRDTLSKALRDAGLQGITVTHGFRATMRTIGRERLKIDADVLEAQLAHAKKGEVLAAYDRTQFLEERHELVQKWADYLSSMNIKDS
jgi:integrase